MQTRQFLTTLLDINMIPTRGEIQAQIEKIEKEQPYVDVNKAIREWVNALDMPEIITIAGEEVNPKRQILSDLITYKYA